MVEDPAMAEDPRSGEACVKFLEENKTKEGVITLASGLQYRVLKYGTGLKHPKVGVNCECHYRGTFIDGSEFDSSYSRNAPSTFAPNQVIKGWTEAMQLMVEGDTWEMYIPYFLAYGEEGEPPKIPAKAALIFQMEILKIKDPEQTTPVVFPEWTPQDLALWEEKDEKPVRDWRDSRIKSYEDGKLRDKHPTREGFDEWIDKTCKNSKNKSLWTRTRQAKNKQLDPPSSKKEDAPKLTKETARELLTKALGTFKLAENKSKLKGIVEECEAMGADQAPMMKMMKLMPAVQEMVGDTLKEYGFQPSDLMTVTMQVQAFAAEDASIAADTGKLMKAVQGDFADLLGE